MIYKIQLDWDAEMTVLDMPYRVRITVYDNQLCDGPYEYAPGWFRALYEVEAREQIYTERGNWRKRCRMDPLPQRMQIKISEEYVIALQRHAQKLGIDIPVKLAKAAKHFEFLYKELEDEKEIPC